MPFHRPRLRLTGVTVLAGASVAALLSTRPSLSASSWSRGDDLAVATAWLVAVGASIWLFSACGTCLLAIGVRRPNLARAFALALPYSLRRSVEIAVVASTLVVGAAPAHAVTGGAGGVLDQPVVRAPRSLVVAPTTAPATAPRGVPDAAHTTIADRPSPPTTAHPPRPAPTTSLAPRPLPRRSAFDSRRTAKETPDTPAPIARTPHQDERVVVRPADNLWEIARAELTRRTGALPDDRQVVHYWRSVIEANRSTLRSGNPSLIFPGEIVALPPVPHVS
jgi:hypothetical protein